MKDPLLSATLQIVCPKGEIGVSQMARRLVAAFACATALLGIDLGSHSRRAATRVKSPPDFGSFILGFRVARDLVR